MSTPPSSLVVSPHKWSPNESGLPSGLFVAPHSGHADEIFIHISHVQLSWTDRNGRLCNMELGWDHKSMLMSGNDVTIYDVSDPSQHQPIATGLTVRIKPMDSETWEGRLTPEGNSGVFSPDESNPGVFIAQAGTGGPPPDSYGGPERESVLHAVTSAAS